MPAAIGSTRLSSTLYGGLANIGTDSFERKGIQFILERQDYTELAKHYDLNVTDMAVSGAFGAFFGALGYRSPQARFESEVAEHRESLKKNLTKAGYSEEEADVQAGQAARGEVLFAKQAGVEWKDVGYTIERTESSQATDGFHMPVTQGVEWHMGPTKLAADTPLEMGVWENNPKPLNEVVSSFHQTFKESVLNTDTGLMLSASGADIGKWTSHPRRRWFLQVVGDDLVGLVEGARLVESHVDKEHGNPEVRGIHKLVNAVRIGDQNLRVVITIRDYSTIGRERTSISSIDNIDFEPIEKANPPVYKASATSGFFDGDTVPAPEVAQHPVGPHPFRVTLSQVLGGD